jgi:hypothetical protein
MGRRVGWALVVVMAGGGVAQASGRHEQWKSVKRLGVGVAVEVRSEGQAGVEECRVVRVDDVALTCDREKDPDVDWDAGSGARLVFPRNAVEEVQVWTDASDRRVLIAMGIGFGIGALVCSEGGPGPAFICAGIGALIGASFAISGPPAGPWWYPPGPPRPAPQREMVWKLVYRAPAGGAVSP